MATENPVARQIVVSAPRITVTATYRSGRAQVLAILRTAGLPSPVLLNPAAMLRASRASRASRGAVPAVPASATNFTGLGFDTCAAPGPGAMSAWLAHSRYKAIGIYIGGSDRACAQANLTASWVSQQAAAGWHFIPLYVGPQVSFSGEVTAPKAQAVAAAQDAVVQAQSLGFGAGTPIYYDMEAYLSGRSRVALKFFSAWSSELHSLGYKSAIYSSSDSGMTDLARNYATPGFIEPDVVYDAWWNGVQDTSDPNIPPGEWVNHQRVHQFGGNVTESHGGYAINIDQDYLDVQLGSGGGGGGGGGGSGGPVTRQASQAVSTPNRVVDAFYTGTDGGLWYTRYFPHAGWSAPARLAGPVTGEPSAVAVASGVEVFCKASTGVLEYLTSSGTGWSGPNALQMGMLGGSPHAVSAGNGDVAVFWRGTDASQLWSASYTPAKGWRGPTHIGGGLASDPSPAVSGSGTISVFWKGSDGQLWFRSQPAGGTWSAPAALSMGQLGTGPEATGQRGGQVGVFWGGPALGSVWGATYTRQGGWSAATQAGDGMSGEPVVVASSAGTENGFWKGPGGKLWHTTSQGGSGWGAATALPLGKIGSEIFAAGEGNGVVDVFWRGSADNHLWHARYYARSLRWTHPRDLGGSVG